MRELGPVSLLDALDYLELLAAQRPDRFATEQRSGGMVGSKRKRRRSRWRNRSSRSLRSEASAPATTTASMYSADYFGASNRR